MFKKLLLLSLFALSINAQTVNSIVQKIQIKFASVSDLKADFTQKIISSMSDSPITLNGKFYFKKDDKIRIEISDRTILSDGITIWNHDQKANKVIISHYNNDYTNFSLPVIINSYPDICEKQLVESQSGLSIIKLTPIDDQLNFKSALISIDKNDMIEKVEITDFNDMRFLFKLDSIEVNNKLSDQFFSFEPSEGVEIIDLR